jgi:tRNA dimethylallyltransferase
VVIAGATATGKTRLSLHLAASLPRAEVVSADSRQVYRGMDVGTAKASRAERATVPHHGLDLVEPDEPFSVAHYRRAADAALRDIGARGGIALLVGGTGLYLRAVARGLPLDGPGADPATRADLERRLVGDGLAALVDELRRRDPEAAAGMDLANPRRVVRALERALLTGSAQAPPAHGYPAPSLWLGLQREPAIAAASIEERARAQLAGGLLEEAAALRARHDETLPAFSAIGYREAFAVLEGSLDREAALARMVARTRAYAKRQRTWLRSEPDVAWLDADDEPGAAALALVEAFLEPATRSRLCSAR